MQRTTCDLCGKELHPSDDHHYVIKIEAFAAQDPREITEADLDQDHLEAISQILTEMEDNPAAAEFAEPTRSFRYDLCCKCHRKFVRDPLGRAQLEKLNFSEN